ncbi:MAG TPA: glycosyltransferase [Syntrophorhabdus sp.]|jgi:GT2 family glycosyltransferase|nr:glycosyltransferase [Syntrophorhabdus sp.]
MDISFIILTWNSARYIDTCLQSVIDDTLDASYSFEIFIVDNGSCDETRNIVQQYKNKYPESIKPIYLEKNTGTTYSRNLALKKASGRYIVIMDSDIRMQNGAMNELIKTLESDSRLGLVVPALRYPSGNLQKSTDRFPTLPSKLMRYFFLKLMESRQNQSSGSADGIGLIEYAISAFWLLRREVVEQVGYLDEKIFYAPEDVDYCMRVWKKGYWIAINHDVNIIHDAQEISRGFKINQATIHHIRGLIYYFSKHKYLFRRPRFKALGSSH